MRKNTYTVRFNSDRAAIMVSAFTPTEAKIIAQAERIKAGKDYRVQSVDEVGES